MIAIPRQGFRHTGTNPVEARVYQPTPCPICGTRFTPRCGRHRYCSDKCSRQAKYRGKRTGAKREPKPADRMGFAVPSDPDAIMEWIVSAPWPMFASNWTGVLTERAMERGGIAFVARALVAVRERYRNRA